MAKKIKNIAVAELASSTDSASHWIVECVAIPLLVEIRKRSEQDFIHQQIYCFQQRMISSHYLSALGPLIISHTLVPMNILPSAADNH